MKSEPHDAIAHALRNSAIEAEEERARADALFLSIGEGAIATDEQGKISRINQVAMDLFGFEDETEVIGSWFPKLIQAVDDNGAPIEAMDRPIVKAFLRGSSVTTKTRYVKKDGSVFPAFITVSPILLAGSPIGAIEVFRDITIESEIDRMKSEFISIASHQLRTPLAAIKTYTHMLASGFVGQLSQEQVTFLDIVLASTDRMNDLISTLLNVTRIEAGRIAVVPKDILLEDLIGEIMTELQPRANEKQIDLGFKPVVEAATVKTDALLVKEVYVTLLSNAVKYTPNGGKVTTRLLLKDENFIIAVRDNGYGIPRNLHNRVFTKFFRGSNITSRETVGTGLGLYMVQGIVEMLGGKIWFRSDEGKGSTFYFSLPVTGTPAREGSTTIEISNYLS
jgi:PAS domain S-box-containing protein